MHDNSQIFGTLPPSPPPPAPPSPPLPRLQPVGAKQSSDYFTWYAPLAIDGNTNSNLLDDSCSTTLDDAAGAWW